MKRQLSRAIRYIKKSIYGEVPQLQKPIPSVFRRYNIIFIHVPKAGGSTVKDTLFGFGVRHRTIESYTMCDPDFTMQAFKFAFVRHPYTRFVSAYNYLKAGGKNDNDARFRDSQPEVFRTLQSFAEASEDQAFRSSIVHLRDQTHFLCLQASDPYFLHMDYVAKIEFLDHHIDILCPLMHNELQSRLQLIKSKRLNASKSASKEIDRDLFERIRRIYSVDFEVLGYDEWGTPELTADLMAQQQQRQP